MSWNAVLPGVLLLGVVIFVHELGHFLMAKWRGVRVLRFSLGFGPAMFKVQRGETEYQLAWIPFGGYVQMAGDSPDPDGGMPGAPDEFLSHHWVGRMLIAIAGPAANLVTATIVMMLVGVVGLSSPDYPNVLGEMPATSPAALAGLASGDRVVALNGTPVTTWAAMTVAESKAPAHRPVTLSVERDGATATITVPAVDRDKVFESLNPPAIPPVIGSVMTGMPAYKAGLQEQDRIVAVNGRPIRRWDELPVALRGTVDKTVRLDVVRGGRTIAIDVVPMSPEGKGEQAVIGIEPPRQGTYVQHFPLLESMDLGLRAMPGLIGSVYSGMWRTITRPLYYREYVGGPLFIAQAASEQARRGLDSFLQFLAMINIAVMAFNLMPLPILDGGHILLALIEAVRRQAISARAYVRFQQVGLAVMGTLLVLILVNDPWRIVQRQRALGREHSATTAQQRDSAGSAPGEKTVAPTPP